MPLFFKVLILFLGSTRKGFHAWMFKKTPYFSHILHCCSTSLPSLPVTLYLVPVSMKPLLPKSAMCSDWLARPVCCDWSTALSVFRKCHALTICLWWELFKWEILRCICFWKKTQDYNSGVSGSSESSERTEAFALNSSRNSVMGTSHSVSSPGTNFSPGPCSWLRSHRE